MGKWGFGGRGEVWVGGVGGWGVRGVRGNREGGLQLSKQVRGLGSWGERGGDKQLGTDCGFNQGSGVGPLDSHGYNLLIYLVG